MISSTVENYLKELFLLDYQGLQQIATGVIAKSLNVTPGSATSMIKTLAESGLVEHKPHYGVKLTDRGRCLAIRVVRRHRIVEMFLVQILGMDWCDVHDEAEKLEHVVSDEIISRMDKILGHPNFDPHGDPIPTADGTIPSRTLQVLSHCNSGDVVTIARINDQNASFLKFAEENGLTLGTKIEISRKSEIAESITILSEKKAVVLGLSAANRIEVEHA
ncbi:MAG: metal-dependent transcriptional regulator [Phycisphaerales bacterium]|jgi:DtxR family Mn-dependent transcriptional regulator|nr:metal-dependent transcriptional regulator [Phycisphaerales bacterium]